MPITWSQAKVTYGQLLANQETAGFSWFEFSVAYELYLLSGYGSRKRYDELFDKNPNTKKKVIELIMKVKSNKIQQKVEIPLEAKVSISDIDMVIQEVLFKPKVKIYVN